jgi:hypothetical protein
MRLRVGQEAGVTARAHEHRRLATRRGAHQAIHLAQFDRATVLMSAIDPNGLPDRSRSTNCARATPTNKARRSSSRHARRTAGAQAHLAGAQGRGLQLRRITSETTGALERRPGRRESARRDTPPGVPRFGERRRSGAKCRVHPRRHRATDAGVAPEACCFRRTAAVSTCAPGARPQQARRRPTSGARLRVRARGWRPAFRALRDCRRRRQDARPIMNAGLGRVWPEWSAATSVAAFVHGTVIDVDGSRTCVAVIAGT